MVKVAYQSLEEVSPDYAPQESTAGPTSLAEKCFVFCCVLLIVTLPPIFTEPFPLTRTPMFARPMAEERLYKVVDNYQHNLNADMYGLRGNVNDYLEKYYAVQLPPSQVAPIDRPADIRRVLANIRSVGTRQCAAFPLTLRLEVVGPTGSDAIGVIERQQWTIDQKQPTK